MTMISVFYTCRKIACVSAQLMLFCSFVKPSQNKVYLILSYLIPNTRFRILILIISRDLSIYHFYLPYFRAPNSFFKNPWILFSVNSSWLFLRKSSGNYDSLMGQGAIIHNWHKIPKYILINYTALNMQSSYKPFNTWNKSTIVNQITSLIHHPLIPHICINKLGHHWSR